MTGEITVDGITLNGLNSIYLGYPFLLIGLMQFMSREKAGICSVVFVDHVVLSRGLKTVPRYYRHGDLVEIAFN